MQLQAIVWNPAYDTVLSDGPLFPVECGFTRGLDRIGRGRIQFAGTDVRALQYLDSRRVVEVWAMPDEGEILDGVSKRMVGALIIDDMQLRHEAGQLIYNVAGSDTMQALKDVVTLPGLEYHNQTVTAVVTDLIGLVSGWSATIDAGLASTYIDIRFNGESVFKALAVVAEFMGQHIRLDTSTSKTIEFGAFGADNGERVIYIEGDSNEGLYGVQGPLLMERLEMVEQSGELVNTIFLYGAGDGDAALTLEDSNRSGISNVSKNGRTHYYITDAASVAAYGQIERRVNIKRIGPTSTSATHILNAANALYDAGYEWLQRHKDPYEMYRATLYNSRVGLEPGDKLNLRYQGWVVRGSDRYQFKDVDALVWLMSVEEVYNGQGLAHVVEMATIDRHAENAASIIVGTTDAIDINNVHVQPTINYYMYGPYQKLITTNNSATFRFTVRNNTLKIDNVALVIRRYPETSHDHLIAQVTDTSLTAPSSASPRIVRFYNGVTTIDTLMMVSTSVGSSGDTFYTKPESDDYDVEGSSLPVDIDITVNGSTVATGLWATGSDTEQEYDVTTEIQGRVGGIRGIHEVVVTCASGYGWIEVELQIEDQIGMIGAQY